MLQAHDGQRVADESELVDFSGYYIKPGAQIEIQARNPATGEFDAIAEATAAEGTFLGNADFELFGWSTKAVIPPQYWEPAGCVGSMARVRAHAPADQVALQSVDEGWWDCLEEQGGQLGRAAVRCSAEQSPVARIYTEKYEPVPEFKFEKLAVMAKGCTDHEFGFVIVYVYGIQAPEWHGPYGGVHARVQYGGREQGMTCSYNPGAGSAMCELPLGTADGHIFDTPQEFVDAFEYMNIRIQGEVSCGHRLSYATFPWRNLSSSVFHRNFDDDCFPPSVEPGNQYDFTCACSYSDGKKAYTVAIDGYACYDANAGHPPAVLGWACKETETHFSALYNRAAECEFLDVGFSGSCNERPFARNFYTNIRRL